MTLSFSKLSRLLNSADFQYVFAKPQRFFSNNLLMLVRKNDREISRLGLAISKKKIKKAHERNRIKRLTREFFRNRKHEVNGIDIILLAKSDLTTLTNKEIVQQLEQLWQRLTTFYQKSV